MGFPLPADREEIVFLTVDDIHDFHQQVLLPGQDPHVNKLDDLLSAVGRPKSAAYYDDDPDLDLLKIAAYYWHGVSANHGYVDGNKRTGLVCATNFLLMNGMIFDAPDEYIGIWVEALFKHDEFEIPNLQNLLRKHTRWI